MSNNDLRHKKCGSQHHPMDCPDDKPDRLTEILEKVFNRGYNHGISKGLSDDGETYAVTQARTQIVELFLETLEQHDIDEGHHERYKTGYIVCLATIREKWGLK